VAYKIGLDVTSRDNYNDVVAGVSVHDCNTLDRSEIVYDVF